MTTYLLDANVLIALTVAEHEFHDRASRWAENIESFALCPLVEGALVRFLVRIGEAAHTAQAVLAATRRHPRHVFWADHLSFADIDLAHIQGHRQVTDAYLVALADHHGGQLATFDRGLRSVAHRTATLLT